MPLVQGSVTVAEDGTVTSSGLAKSLYDADVATLELATPPSPGDTTAPYSAAYPAPADVVDQITAANIRALQEAARRANALAAGFLVYFLAHNDMVFDVGVGKTGDPLFANSVIVPLDVPVTLHVV